MASGSKWSLLICAIALCLCGSQLGSAQQIVWERQVQGYLDGVEMAFYIGGLDYSKPVVADIDGDGDGDLYVGEFDGYLDIFENLGGNPPNWACFCTALDTIDVGQLCAPSFWDYDNDSDLDLLLGNAEGRIWQYRNDGPPSMPTWTLQTNYWDSIDVGYHAVPFYRDLDADGDLDLLIANNSGGAVHFRNTGTITNPNFRYETSYYQNIDLGMKSTVCVFDLNADNLQDLIMSSLDGHILYFRNHGPASNPTYINEGTIAAVPRNGAPTLWDLDGDGDLDLLSGEADGNMNYWTNVGTPSQPNMQLTTHNLAYYDAGLDSKPALADLDNDGDLDLLIGRYRWGMTFLSNTGTPDSAAWSLEDTAYTGFNVYGAECPAFCDLNNDGDFDLVLGLEDGTMAYLQNIGTPAAPVWAAPVNNFANIDVGTKAAPAFADIDGDMDYDLFIGSQAGTIRYLRNNGGVTNPIWQDLGNFPSLDVGYNSRPTFADLEEDGDYDMIVGSGNLQGWLTYYRNIGSAYLYSWATGISHYGNWDFGDNAAPYLADLDNNGHADLLVGSNSGGLWLLNNFGPLHDVDLTMTPVNPPIEIPPQGGEFQFTIAVTAGESAFTGAVWCNVTMPDGSTFGPTVGPATITVAAGTSISRLRTQGVLNTAPPGQYAMNGLAGLYPDSVWAQDSFPFEKSPFGDGEPVTHWYNFGEAFGDEAPSNRITILPNNIGLENHPNPFNPSTVISYQLSAKSFVSLQVYDTAGRIVQTLVCGWREAGRHEVAFNGAGLPSGIYLYKLQAGEFQSVGKMVLMK